MVSLCSVHMVKKVFRQPVRAVLKPLSEKGAETRGFRISIFAWYEELGSLPWRTSGALPGSGIFEFVLDGGGGN